LTNSTELGPSTEEASGSATSGISQHLRDPKVLTVFPRATIDPYIFKLRYFSWGAAAPVWALAYLHEILRFTSVL
jgi:hypothetical protein